MIRMYVRPPGKPEFLEKHYWKCNFSDIRKMLKSGHWYVKEIISDDENQIVIRIFHDGSFPEDTIIRYVRPGSKYDELNYKKKTVIKKGWVV